MRDFHWLKGAHQALAVAACALAVAGCGAADPPAAKSAAATSDAAAAQDSGQPGTGDAADSGATPDSGGADVAPDAAPNGTADTALDAVAGDVPDTAGEDADDAAPDAAPDVAPSADAVPDDAPDAAPDVAPDAALSADTAADVGPPPCLPTAPSTEVCDGQDNDCDGTIDAQPDGSPPLCNDGNSCTTDKCLGFKGCAFPPAGEAGCSDGNPCTAGDYCAGSTCKAGGAKCEDGNVCTTNTCDTSSGNCLAPVAIGGCSPCKSAADCGDANDCTADACTAGACAWTAIAGCVGPTDYFVSKFWAPNPTWPMPGYTTFKLYVTNLGKAYGGAATGKLKYEVWLSADAAIGAGDLMLYETAWTGKVVYGPTFVEAYIDMGGDVNDLTKLPKGITHACVRLKDGGDVNLKNNDACTPVTLTFAELQVSELYPLSSQGNGTVLSGEPIQFAMQVKAISAAGASTIAHLYLSDDAVLDDKDIKVSPATGIGLGSFKAAESKYLKPQVTLPALASGPYYACVVVNADAYTFEKVPTDNVLCTKFQLWTPADLTLDANHLRFRTAAGAIHDNPPFGLEYACYLAQVGNAGHGAAKDVPVRCWLSPTKKAWPGEVGWAQEWTLPEPLAGKSSKTAQYNPKVSKLTPPVVGDTYICGDLNAGGSVDELTNDNYVCRKIAVGGPDLYVFAGYAAFGTTAPQGQGPKQPATMPRGVVLYGQLPICNKGNAAVAATTKIANRILLSQDATASADDYVIHSAPAMQYPTAINPQTSFQYDSPFNCAWGFDGSTKFTLPTSLVPGNYKLIFEVNQGQGILDPAANNWITKDVKLL